MEFKMCNRSQAQSDDKPMMLLPVVAKWKESRPLWPRFICSLLAAWQGIAGMFTTDQSYMVAMLAVHYSIDA